MDRKKYCAPSCHKKAAVSDQLAEPYRAPRRVIRKNTTTDGAWPRKKSPGNGGSVRGVPEKERFVSTVKIAGFVSQAVSHCYVDQNGFSQYQ